MIGQIAGKELLNTFKTVRFLIVILICCLLTPISVWVLSSDYLKEVQDYQGRVELEQRRETGKDFLINVYRPVPQLSALFRGTSGDSVNSISLRGMVGWNMPTAAATQSITHAIFPTVDLTFIIGIVLSALAVMLSFDSVSGEKSDATLRLMVSNPVQRSSVILGKWLGLVLTLWIPFLVGMIISLLIFFGVTGIELSPDNWAALGLAITTCLIYLALFVLMGIVVSATTTRRTVSIFASLALWGALVILLPQIANAVSDIIEPVPSSQEIEKNIRLAYNNFANTIRKENREISEKAIQEKWEDQQAMLAMFRNTMDSGVGNNKAINDLEREFWLKVTRQENAGRTLSLVSPFSSLTQALIVLADTGPEIQREFLRRAYSHGESYFSRVWDQLLGGASNDETEVSEEFSFEGLSLDKRVEMALPPMAALLIMNILLAIVGVIAFNRYDPR